MLRCSPGHPWLGALAEQLRHRLMADAAVLVDLDQRLSSGYFLGVNRRNSKGYLSTANHCRCQLTSTCQTHQKSGGTCSDVTARVRRDLDSSRAHRASLLFRGLESTRSSSSGTRCACQRCHEMVQRVPARSTPIKELKWHSIKGNGTHKMEHTASIG